MKKHLILVKHSLPEIVENVPARDWHLSEEGRLRAKRLTNRLMEYQPRVLISSVEPKATETAEIIARNSALDVQVFQGLHEHDRSTTPYLSGDEFQIAVDRFFSRPNELVFGHETAEQAYGRFSAAIHSILKTYPDQIIAIVAHGTVISLFVSHLTGVSGYSLWQQLGLPAFVVLDINTNALITHENIP